jgi:hypothetical protein
MTDIKKKSIPWQPAETAKVLPLGRNLEHDPRSLSFVAEEATKIVSVIHTGHSLPLDQTRGSCTAEALIGALDTDPDFKGKSYVQSDADLLYDEEVREEGYDPAKDDPGGTGLAVCKAARKMGLIKSYTHAFGLQSSLRALVKRPIICGVNWYSSFDDPDPRGLITLKRGAFIRGGHEVLVVEIDTHRQEIGCWNSWGSDWGNGGRFRMSWDLWGKLLAEDGDVTVPIV